MAVAAPPRRSRYSPRPPLRILTAVPLCDGHDSAITTINLELARRGIEVVYLGYHQSASAIARAAVQEDVHAVGLSSYNGGHRVFFGEVRKQLRSRGAADIELFGGGGGTITPADVHALKRAGVERIFSAGTPLDAIAEQVRRDFARTLKRDPTLSGDRALARAITLAEAASSGSPEHDTGNAPRAASRRRNPASTPLRHSGRAFRIGFAGPGGAGKSTLIDELTARFLRSRRRGRIAVLANDPSQPDGGGALLGDRVSAIYSQDDRVFFRSLATRGHAAGVSAATPAVLELLRRSGEFDLILVESIGIGQESDPFRRFGPDAPLVDATVLVLSPHYGGPIQLQKLALIGSADLVVLNKCDDPRATTARAEITARLAANTRPAPLHSTIAARHDDPGVGDLYTALAARAGLEPPGGEKACQLQITA